MRRNWIKVISREEAMSEAQQEALDGWREGRDDAIGEYRSEKDAKAFDAWCNKAPFGVVRKEQP